MVDISHAELKLIGDIYDAAMKPDLWPGVMEQIARLANSHSSVITALDVLNPDYTFIASHNLPQELFDDYRKYGYDVQDMEVNGRAMIEVGFGKGIRTEQFFGDIEEYKRRAGDYYAKFLKKYDILYQSGVLLDFGDYRWGALGVHQSESRGPFGEKTVELMGRLGPHIQRALQIHRQLSTVREQNARLYAMLDQLALGVVMLNEEMLSVYANPVAARIIRQHPAIDATPQHGLRANNPAQREDLRRLLSNAVSLGQRLRTVEAGAGVIGLTVNGSSPLMLSATPVSALAGYQELERDGVVAAVFITDPEAGHVLASNILLRNYAMTPREVQICQEFVNLASLERTAAALGIGMSTVRHYIKSIYAKTDKHSLPELMKLLVNLSVDFEHIR